ncbi:MAG: tetratricopeptide repeat protein [Acidobacteria bacterium]|nr:tetratricopeptide repeat protein [Acidobacteriota bacterium]
MKNSKRLLLTLGFTLLAGSGFSLLARPLTPAAADPAVEQETQRRAQAYYHYSLGHLYEEMAGATGRTDYLERAIQEFKQALTYDPDSTLLTVRLAEAYRRAGRIRDAVLEAEAVVKADPKNLPARRLLARIYLQTLGELQPGQANRRTLELAIEQYEAIVGLAPDDLESRLFLARLYRLNSQPDKAEATLKEVLASEPRSEQVLAALAQLYTEQGQYERAIELLREATDQEPSSELLATLAYAYEQGGDSDNAIAAYRRALEQDSGNSEIRQRLAQALLDAARYDEALSEYQTLIRQNPEDFQTYLRLSQIHRHRGDFEQAGAYLDRAEEISPDNLEIGFNRALLYEAGGKFAEAVETLTDLVASVTRTDGQNDRARALLLEQLGMLHRRLENFDAAVQSFELLLELDDEHAARAYTQIIETLRQSHDLNAAIARARQARERFPEISGFRLQLATLLGEHGDLAEAEQLARAALDGQPEDREVYLALAQIYERNKRYQDAEQVVDAAQRLSASPAELEYVHFLRGAIYERQKKHDLAEQEFRQVLEMNPRNALALNYLGYMFADQGVQLDESVALVKRALDIDPYNGAYLDSLGWAYYRQEKLDLAEEYLRRAVERVRRDPTVHDHLGDLYEKLGRLDLARHHWERSLAEWKRVPKTEFDTEAYGQVEAKLRALRARLPQQTKK